MNKLLPLQAQYIVVGNPINHSKSPAIHSLFAHQTRQQLIYRAQLFPLDSFSDGVDRFIKIGGLGMNITVPFKQQAYEKADVLSSSAALAGAVNTLSFKTDGIYGENTDGVGLVKDLTVNNRVPIKDQDILIIGAGGAVRGVLEPIIAQQPKSITIANRTIAKAHDLADVFEHLFQIKVCEFSQLPDNYNIVINGTSSSLNGELPAIPKLGFNDQTIFYDMMYSKEITLFNQWGIELGIGRTFDGLGMLVEQAAEAFRIWRGVSPDTKYIISQIRSQL
jgi:shikimate dehydrogenase